MDDNTVADIAARRLAVAAGAARLHHDGRKRLPHFVVQFARQGAAFLFLGAHQPRRKRLQIRARFDGLLQPPLHFALEPQRQSRRRDRQHHAAQQGDSEGDVERQAQIFRRLRPAAPRRD